MTNVGLRGERELLMKMILILMLMSLTLIVMLMRSNAYRCCGQKRRWMQSFLDRNGKDVKENFMTIIVIVI